MYNVYACMLCGCVLGGSVKMTSEVQRKAGKQLISGKAEDPNLGSNCPYYLPC